VAWEGRGDYADRVAAYALGGARWLRIVALQSIAELKVISDQVRTAVLRGTVSENGEIVYAAYEAADALNDSLLNEQIDRSLAELTPEEKKRIEEARKG
jgi:hypothetical protein